MKILVNHLTRMHGGHICVAGVDLDTRQHVRPVMQEYGMPFHFLSRYGGPFDMAQRIELGRLRPDSDPPHVEDHIFVPAWAKVECTAEAYEFWSLLRECSSDCLAEIFGDALQEIGRSHLGTALGQGDASLGFLRPAEKPKLYLETPPQGKPRIRMKITDGRIQADAAVTDLRLCGSDHATPDPAKVRGVAHWIEDSAEVILSVGLTRKFRASPTKDYFHWLQVNNIHLKEDPTWSLG